MEQRRGEEIDDHDVVIRLKRCSETLKYPEQYGTKTDIVCGSYTIRHGLREDMPDADSYWVFVDSRHTEIEPEEGYWYCEKSLCDAWNEIYRAMRSEMPLDARQERKQTSDELGHTHMSAGLHALLYAARIYPHINLYGFDNVASGGFTWSVTRGPDWSYYPDHNWATEARMVPLIAGAYGVEVNIVR